MNEWDQRYDSEEYRYGEKPVSFLTEAVEKRKPGKALCIGAGEGRNAVWLASRGWDVTALDLSRVGLDKAETLAAQHSVSLKTVVGNAAEWEMQEEEWDLITLFFVHAPPTERAKIHEKAAAALNTGGCLVLEGFTPRQLGKGTGGPGSKAPGGQKPSSDTASRFIEPEELKEQLPGLVFEMLTEDEIQLDGGTMHSGPGIVVHCIATKK